MLMCGCQPQPLHPRNTVQTPTSPAPPLRPLPAKQDRASEFIPDKTDIPKEGSFIFEKFLTTGGTDIKVWLQGVCTKKWGGGAAEREKGHKDQRQEAGGGQKTEGKRQGRGHRGNTCARMRNQRSNSCPPPPFHSNSTGVHGWPQLRPRRGPQGTGGRWQSPA